MKEVLVGDIFNAKEDLEIFMFNVGQGDHILLKFPNHEYGIIDFHSDPKNKISLPPALTYFQALKKNLPDEFSKVTIAFFCISHTDQDHIKGIYETIEWFDLNHVFIKHIWFGAARDESQFLNFMGEQFDEFKNQLPEEERVAYAKKIDAFDSGKRRFFDAFERWKTEQFKCPRYKTESFGRGDYLGDMKPLSRPCSTPSAAAFNLAPQSGDLDKYYKQVLTEVFKKTIGVDIPNAINRNCISHILQIIFGGKSLIFGGDADKETWENFIKKYHSEGERYVDDWGPLKPDFIKVSHHGSSGSSSQFIWDNVIKTGKPIHLGISAGRNKKYNHANSQTFKEIRAARSDAKIYVTNICGGCIESHLPPIEYHSWYEKAIDGMPFYESNTEELIKTDKEIDHIIKTSGDFIKQVPHQTSVQAGLFAYIFKVPLDSDKEISLRMALSRKIKKEGCFYMEHEEPFCEKCKKAIPS